MKIKIIDNKKIKNIKNYHKYEKKRVFAKKKNI